MTIDPNTLNSRERFRRRFRGHVCAGCSGLYVDSSEMNLIVEDVDEVMRQSGGGKAWLWSVTKGLTPTRESKQFLAMEKVKKLLERNELSACLSNLDELHREILNYEREEMVELQKKSEGYDPDADYTVHVPFTLILENFNLYLQNPVIIQGIIDAIQEGRSAQRTILLAGTNVSIPAPLENLVHKLDRELPDFKVIEEIARATAINANSNPSETGDEEIYARVFPVGRRENVFRAARGMTETEVLDAFSLSYAESPDGVITPEAVGEHKKKFLARSPALEIFTSGEGFDTLAGMDALKNFMLDSLVRRANKKLFPRGVMLVGPPGTAKTEIARRLAKEVGVQAVLLSVGKLLDRYVGGSEAATATALKTIEAMAPCILVIDEVEKALAGSTGQGTSSDGGTMARTLGTLLTWLSCKTSEVYVVGTSNNISSLPPELTRSGRFDAVFFLDMPFAEQRQAIWQIYRDKHEISPGDMLPDDEEWTGAEIEHCCYMACMHGKTLREAAEYIIPVNRSAGSKLDAIRGYADGSLIDANYGGPYSLEKYRHLRKEEKIKPQPAKRQGSPERTSRRPLARQNIFEQN